MLKSVVTKSVLKKKKLLLHNYYMTVSRNGTLFYIFYHQSFIRNAAMSVYCKHLTDTLLACGPSIHDYINGMGDLATALSTVVCLKDDQLHLDDVDPYYFRKVTRFAPGEHYVTYREKSPGLWSLGLTYTGCDGKTFFPVLGLHQIRKLRELVTLPLCSSFHTILQIKSGILPNFTSSQIHDLCNGELSC